MDIAIEGVAPYLGQTVVDLYGRKVGILVGIYSDVDGKVSSFEIMTNDASYETITAERFERDADGFKLLPEWLVEAKKLERKLDILRKRFKSMEELSKKNQIPQHAYRELKERYSKDLDKLRIEIKNLKDILRKRTYELENFVLHIEKAFTHLLISYTSGELPENGFKVSAECMRSAKQAALDEKKDVEKHMALIDKLEQELAAITQPQEEIQITSPTAVQQPIAVKVVTG
ncbi:MAG: CdvA-like protein [Sulfolobales archaeon]|nr:CdvA-like protein [Ignisphaera sp.]MCX8199751.1 CdvA-like protein [Sulfolobales archaeon]MDW8085011.1 CdvA-like protein [Ignisphaera sp.]